MSSQNKDLEIAYKAVNGKVINAEQLQHLQHMQQQWQNQGQNVSIVQLMLHYKLATNSQIQEMIKGLPPKISFSFDSKKLFLWKDDLMHIWDFSHQVKKKYPLVHWAKPFPFGRKISKFDFRYDVPGHLIEIKLKNEPKKIAQYLFNTKITNVFSVVPWFPKNKKKN